MTQEGMLVVGHFVSLFDWLIISIEFSSLSID